MQYPSSISDLIECFKKLPGIGEKTAERLSLSILDMDNDIVNLFSKSIINVKEKVHRCEKCNGFSEEKKCKICNDKERDIKTICIVEEPKNIILFEKTGVFNGIYHVLDGLISPLEGINPEDININNLFERIKTEKIKEVILALKPSIEGETTSLYIKKLLEGYPITVTKIAHGIPLGVDMEYIDTLTLEMALEDRKNVS